MFGVAWTDRMSGSFRTPDAPTARSHLWRFDVSQPDTVTQDVVLSILALVMFFASVFRHPFVAMYALNVSRLRGRSGWTDDCLLGLHTIHRVLCCPCTSLLNATFSSGISKYIYTSMQLQRYNSPLPPHSRPLERLSLLRPLFTFTAVAVYTCACSVEKLRPSVHHRKDAGGAVGAPRRNL